MKNSIMTCILLLSCLGASAADATPPPAGAPAALAAVIAALNEIVPLRCGAPTVTGTLYSYSCVKTGDGKAITIQASAPYRNPALNAQVMIQAPVDLGEAISDADLERFTRAVAQQSLQIYRDADPSVSWDGTLSAGNGVFQGGDGLSAAFHHADQTSALFVESNLENGRLLRVFIGLAG